MRFLMLNWRDPRNPKAGGAERVTQAFLGALEQRGHEVYWFANDFAGATREEVIQGIRILRGGGQGSSILRAREWYRTHRPFDLVIDQHHGIPWYAPWWSRTNCVAYIHEVLGPIWDAFYRWPLNIIGRRQERWTHWLYRRVPFWTPSESTRQALHKHGVREVKVLPNGTDTTPLDALDPKPLQAPVRLVAVSRLAPNKRVDHALQAAKVLLQRGIATHLTVMGSGDMEAQLRQTASQPEFAGGVTFTGQVSEEEKNRRLRDAHLLIHTSMREGWGLNVIEGNAMGTPAIVYPVGGLVDSTQDGVTGIVTRTETPEAVADAVVRLLDSSGDYERLRQNAWRRSRSFQWKEVLPLTAAWLEEQASRPKRHARG